MIATTLTSRSAARPGAGVTPQPKATPRPAGELPMVLDTRAGLDLSEHRHMTELPSSPQTSNLLPGSKRHGRLLPAARALLAFALVSLLALWLVSLPEYFTRITTLTVESYSQAGEVITSNELVQVQAEARGLSLAAYALYEIALSVLLMAPFWLVAGLILWRAQGEWFGWYTALVLAGLGAVNVEKVFYVAQPPGLVFMLIDLLGWVVWSAMFIWFFLFPGGGAIPRWAWRLVVVAQAIFLALSVRGFLVAWGVLAPDPANLQFVLGMPIVLATLVLVLYAQVYRYRRVYSAVEKQQVKWFVFGMAILLIEVVIFAVAPPDDVSLFVQDLFGMVLLVIPISIGIAILRYRLWDIDVIIRKTLVYTVVTARDETDLDALTGELARIVQETLQPEGVSVWLRKTESPKGG